MWPTQSVFPLVSSVVGWQGLSYLGRKRSWAAIACAVGGSRFGLRRTC